MKNPKLKNTIIITRNFILGYILLSGFISLVYIFTEKFGGEISGGASLSQMQIILLISLIIIYIIVVSKNTVLRDIANKKAIKNAEKIGMFVPSKERYSSIINNRNISKVKIRNSFIHKLSDGMYRYGDGLIQLNYSYRSKQYFYISNEQGELLYIVSALKNDVSYQYKAFSILDPFNRDIGIIKIHPTSLQSIHPTYSICIEGKESYNITFNSWLMTSYNHNPAEKVIKINNVPLKFNNDFFNEEYKINTNCTIKKNNTDEVIAQTYDLGHLGNYNLVLHGYEYKEEAIFLFICLILEKMNFDAGKVLK